MRSGIYVITLVSVNYSEKFQVNDGQENNYKLDLKQVAAATAAAHPEEAKKKEESEDKFKNMKAHFDAGVVALNAGNDLQAQIKSAPADQKGIFASAANRGLHDGGDRILAGGAELGRERGK